MSTLLSAELSATCNAIGTFDQKTGKYLIDEYSVNTVKDLIRYLRRDGEDHEIRIHLGQTKVLQTDLLPMLVDHWENQELFDVVLRLIVNLTNPALLLYKEEIPTEKAAHHNYLTILQHLQSYKEEAFTKVEVWTVFAKKLTQILEIDWTERDDDTGLIIERILILIRNILHVPANLDHEKKPDSDASVHDQVLWALNQSSVLDIILYMTSDNEKQYFMHILEIISHLLREQNPSTLAHSALQRSVHEKIRDEQELLSIRLAESTEKINKTKQFSSTRHSRFGGTYIVQNMKSLAENDMICLKPLNKISCLDFKGAKRSKLVRPKNRTPAESGNFERRSAFALRLVLKEFCIEFLNGSYNTLMRYVKDVLVRSKAQQNDESYYLWAVKFFMEFNRVYNFQVGLISETMSVPMFHFVQQQMETYYDMIKMEKKKFQVWVRRLHLALRAYKELLSTLLMMEKSSDKTVKESATVLKSNIFYVLEYREFILSTFLSYDDNKMPRSYLIDLIETVHLFLKMLEHYCKNTGLVVQKRVKKKTKAKSKKHQVSRVKPSPVAYPVWEEVRAQLAVVVGAPFAHDYPPPFDAASDLPIDQQKEDCVKKIQKLLCDYKFEDAVGMFRAAREVWPEQGIFGESGIPPEEELVMLETIYSAELGNNAETNAAVDDDRENAERDDEDENEELEDEDGERQTAIVETEFNFKHFVERFCHLNVVSACVSVLERYDKNSAHSNHCALKMLHRLAWDCGHPALMFQASLFIIFQRVLANPLPQYKELEKFSIFVLRKFTEIASKNTKVFMELLFWKSSKDSYEIEHGYDLYADERGKTGRGTWTEDQEEELRKLYMENQSNPASDQDVIDWILDNLIDQTRTRRGVIKKLKELGLIFRAPTRRSNKERLSREIAIEFTEQEDETLKDLWRQYADTADPMALIISRMPRKRQKSSYAKRLLQLGMIKDIKECRKKGVKKNKMSDHMSMANGSLSGSDSDRESSSDSDSEPISQPNLKNLNKKSVKSIGKDNRSEKNKTELSASEIGKLLIEAVDQGFSEALKWLAESLEEVALDQEAEGYDPSAEGTPLVPISSESVEAMENSFFQTVLSGLGMASPSDEQESYWRIPSHLHFESIRKRREIIQKAVEKELVVNDSAEKDKSVVESAKVSSDSDDNVFENLRKITGKVLNSDSNDSNEGSNRALHSSSKRKRSSYDSEDTSRINKMQRIEEAKEQDIDDGTDILSFAKKTIQHEDLPDTEDLLSNLRSALSDSSDEEIVTRKPNKKSKRAVIDDDSD